MNAQHTPGPWGVKGEGIHTLVRGSDETIVAVRHRLPGKTHEANARLIAAAPELLKACQAFSKLYGNLWDVAAPSGSGFLSLDSVKKYDEVHAQIAEAISKATGQEGGAA